MFDLFKANKQENENKVKSEVNVKETKIHNYEDKGNEIVINVCKHQGGWLRYYDILIPKSSIITHTDNTFVFKDYEYKYSYYDYYDKHWNEFLYPCGVKSIENKENFITYKETYIKTYNYRNTDNHYDKNEYCWFLENKELENQEIVSEKTPLEIFKEYDSKYKLIETEEELNKYLSSALDCDTWCRMKLYNKMKELGLGDGFINNFADLVGNDLDKYHAMIDLANEVTDKDTLMYLYTFKFTKDEE